jgi:hypothetical protein
VTGKREEEEEVGAGKVIFHARLTAIQRGPLRWRATPARVLNLYPNRNIEGKNIIGTVKVLIEESPTVIMVKVKYPRQSTRFCMPRSLPPFSSHQKLVLRVAAMEESSGRLHTVAAKEASRGEDSHNGDSALGPTAVRGGRIR